MRDVSGVKIPFRVRASRGDPSHDEFVIVELMEFNAAADRRAFAQPDPPKPDFAFPAGRASVEVPFEAPQRAPLRQGHAERQGPVPHAVRFGEHQRAAARALPRRSASRHPAARRRRRRARGPCRPGRRAARAASVRHGRPRRVPAPRRRHDRHRGRRRLRALQALPGQARLRACDAPRSSTRRSSSTRATACACRSCCADSRPRSRPRGRRRRALPRQHGQPRLAHALASLRRTTTSCAQRYGSKLEAVYGASVAGLLRAHACAGARAPARRHRHPEPGDDAFAARTRAPLADRDVAGSIGFGILMRFNVTFDYARRRLYFEKTASTGKPDAWDRAGLWIERGDKGFEVVDVVAGGPAAAPASRPGRPDRRGQRQAVDGVAARRRCATTLPARPAARSAWHARRRGARRSRSRPHLRPPSSRRSPISSR